MILARIKIGIIIRAITVIVRWVEYVLPGCATIWCFMCRDRIFIKTQNDMHFFQLLGSLKVFRVNRDTFSETHSESNMQMEVGGMYLQLAWYQ